MVRIFDAKKNFLPRQEQQSKLSAKQLHDRSTRHQHQKSPENSSPHRHPNILTHHSKTQPISHPTHHLLATLATLAVEDLARPPRLPTATPLIPSASPSAPQAAQSVSILTVAQISPLEQARCTSAAAGQKAANTVLVWPQGCVCA